MTDDLMKRLRDLATEFKGQGGKHYTAELFTECADRIEELTKALGWFVNDVRFTVQVGGNPLTVPGMIDAATKIYFGETLHVPETCKENGESFT